MINSDLTDGVNFVTIVAGGGDAEVWAVNDGDDNSAPFKAGMTVGFNYHQAHALDLTLGGGTTIELLDKDGKCIEGSKVTISGKVLGLAVGNAGSGDFTVTAKYDFYGVKIQMVKGGVDLGGTKIRYAFVRPDVDVNHNCDICPSANTNICDSRNTYQLDWNKEINVKWTVKEQPAGANADVDGNGLVTGMNALGDYVFVATADDGCKAEVTIRRGMDATVDMDNTPLYNMVDDERYELSNDTHGVSGALINIDNLGDSENILNPQFGDYAEYSGGLGLASNVMIVGVKTKDNSVIAGKKRIGFLVETKSDALALDLLNFFRIRAFRNGEESFDAPIEESNAVSLDLIGSSRVMKMRFSIVVPEGKEFDEFQLWKSGVLSLDISKIKIFYAFANDNDNPSEPYKGVKVISNETTGASINADVNHNVGVVSVASVTDNISNLIDNDPEFKTPLMIAKTLAAGGVRYSVKLGRTYSKAYQVGFVIDNLTYTAGVKVGSWVTMTTYKNGVATGDEEKDWKVAGVNAIGAGDKRLMVMQPEKDYDEVCIEFSAVLDALEYINVYGLFVRSDIDGDGVPDIIDENSCMEELVLDEENTNELNKDHDYKNARLVLHRSFAARGSEIGDNKWASLILPVNLTGLQVRNAFGNGVRLAKVKDLNGSMLTFEKINVPANDDNYVVEANNFYIIETVRTPDIEKGYSYETKNDGTLNGEIFFIDGVDYSKEQAENVSLEKMWTSVDNPSHTIVLNGTYKYMDGVNTDLLPEDIYAFSNGLLWNITNRAKMKGFRFYIKENFGTAESKPLKFMIEENGTTGIINIVSDKIVGDGILYDISGRKIGNASDILNVTSGIYIMNGRKIVVK